VSYEHRSKARHGSTKDVFSQRSRARQQQDELDVEIGKLWLPVGDEIDEVSDCFVWRKELDDDGFKCGQPKSDEHAEKAARLVLKHLDKMDYQPKL